MSNVTFADLLAIVEGAKDRVARLTDHEADIVASLCDAIRRREDWKATSVESDYSALLDASERARANKAVADAEKLCAEMSRLRREKEQAELEIQIWLKKYHGRYALWKSAEEEVRRLESTVEGLKADLIRALDRVPRG